MTNGSMPAAIAGNCGRRCYERDLADRGSAGSCRILPCASEFIPLFPSPRLFPTGRTCDNPALPLRGADIMSHSHDHDDPHGHPHEGPPAPGTIDWRLNGVRVIKG